MINGTDFFQRVRCCGNKTCMMEIIRNSYIVLSPSVGRSVSRLCRTGCSAAAQANPEIEADLSIASETYVLNICKLLYILPFYFFLPYINNPCCIPKKNVLGIFETLEIKCVVVGIWELLLGSDEFIEQCQFSITILWWTLPGVNIVDYILN